MEYCKYHPLIAATYHCPHCVISQCDHCVKEESNSRKTNTIQCLLCEQQLDSLGTGNGAMPFWRRLKEAFHYPFNANALTLIIGISVLSTLIGFMFAGSIIGFLLGFLLLGTMLKYAFRCLKLTSEGDMNAPDIQEAYSGGNLLLFQLIGMIILLTLFVGLTGYLFGSATAGLLGTITIIALPAILICLAHTENILSALQPFRVLQVMVSIGLPYGLMIAFIMIMMGSVGVVHELIGNRFSMLGAILQSIVSNYYLLVAFHMMGYMLYQYQDKLGYTARAQGDDSEAPSTPAQIHADQINVFLKEGKYNSVVNLYNEAFSLFPAETRFISQYFEFTYRAANTKLIPDAVNRYLHTLLQLKQFDKINLVYKQAIHVVPSYIPTEPEARLLIAKTCYDLGDPKTAVRMLNGLQKQVPDFPHLGEAYMLLAQALEDIPNMAKHAAKFKVLAEKINQETPTKPKTNHASGKAQFTSKDPIHRAPTASDAQSQNNLECTPVKEQEDNAPPKDLPPIEFKL